MRNTIRAGPHRDFHPREQQGIAAGGILICSVFQAAVQLLPHLVEAMDRAGRVAVVAKCTSVSQLKRTRRQGIDILDARVRSFVRHGGAALDQILVVVSWQAVFRSFCSLHAVVRNVGEMFVRPTDEWCRENAVWKVRG